MFYEPIFLDKENDLNKILKQNKLEPKRMSVLFLSDWDDMCESLKDKMYDQWALADREIEEGTGEPLYIVNSFDMPHSFVIFKTTKVPHLVQFREEEVVSEDYFPMILKRLGLW